MGYATVADARTAGAPTTITDQTLQDCINKWSTFIDAATKQWFESRYLELYIDGTDSRTLFLPVPIIEVTAFFVNGDFINVQDPTLYTVYNRADAARDDRRNPMIKLTGGGLSVFDASDFKRGNMFIRGEQNQLIKGTFGFIESDGTTPALINRACLRLVFKDLQMGPNLWAAIMNGPATAGTITSESTDGHSITYNAFAVTPVPNGVNGITNDPEVDRVLDMYRAPIKISSTVGRGGPDRRW